MTTKFHGVIPPVVTPLTPNGDLDVASYEKLINRLIGQGVDGLFVLGSTSEVAFFDDEMRGRVLSEAKRIIDGRVPLLAGVIDTETLRVIRHIGQAEEIGVDAVVATAPFYAITGPTEIENHFRALHEATDLPLFVYDIPVCVHVKVPVDLMMKLGRGGGSSQAARTPRLTTCPSADSPWQTVLPAPRCPCSPATRLSSTGPLCQVLTASCLGWLTLMRPATSPCTRPTVRGIGRRSALNKTRLPS